MGAALPPDPDDMSSEYEDTGSPNPRYLETAFHIAVEKGLLDIAQLLLSVGVETNTTFQSLRTALHAAVKGGNLDMVRLLLKEGGLPGTTKPRWR